MVQWKESWDDEWDICLIIAIGARRVCLVPGPRTCLVTWQHSKVDYTVTCQRRSPLFFIFFFFLCWKYDWLNFSSLFALRLLAGTLNTFGCPYARHSDRIEQWICGKLLAGAFKWNSSFQCAHISNQIKIVTSLEIKNEHRKPGQRKK